MACGSCGKRAATPAARFESLRKSDLGFVGGEPTTVEFRSRGRAAVFVLVALRKVDSSAPEIGPALAAEGIDVVKPHQRILMRTTQAELLTRPIVSRYFQSLGRVESAPLWARE